MMTRREPGRAHGPRGRPWRADAILPKLDAPDGASRGDVAQLGEHRVRIAGVRGSSPLISTILPPFPGLRHHPRMRLPRPTPTARRPTARVALVALALWIPVLVLAGCGGPSEAGEPLSSLAAPSPAALGSSLPPGTPDPEATASGSAEPAGGPSAELCAQFGTVRTRLAALAALELRPTARTTLDIELSRVEVAYSDLRTDVLDAPDLDVDEALRLLGYRLDDLALAVEDFRTSPRPRLAADHVAEEAVVFGDALAGFELLVGC